jgi:CRISPR-associated protein Cas7/Cse4/CasC, subtype I-E/ECOLI
MSKKLYVDFHIIQTVPPSCLNRDDTNSPKTAIYGGVRRARVSSQAWKKATRDMFDGRGIRTKNVVDVIAEKLDGDMKLAEKIITSAGISLKDKQSKALFLLSDAQASALAEVAKSGSFDKKEAQLALNSSPSIDIALFGRMLADDPKLNIDAACQVAHAISTHKVDTEFDFFTAIDDRSPGDNAGAGMMGTIEYNSATLYRYATIAAHDLQKLLGGSGENTAKAVCEFADAFTRSMPTGKQNTFANRTLPDYVLITLREDQPVNLAGAFESPVKSNDGYASRSVQQLVKYADEVYSKWCEKPLADDTYIVGETGSLKEILEKIEKDVLKKIEEA